MAKLTLDIVTPERKVFSDEVDEVVAPGLLGEFGVLPGHTTLLAELSSQATFSSSSLETENGRTAFENRALSSNSPPKAWM